MRHARAWVQIEDPDMLPPEDGETLAAWATGFCMLTRDGLVKCRTNDGERGWDIDRLSFYAEEDR